MHHVRFDLANHVPSFLPRADRYDSAVALLRRAFSSTAEVTAYTTDEVNFIDAGENFEAVACGLCAREIDMDWWGEAMGEAASKDFTDLAIVAPCCGGATSLNDLRYEMPQGFALAGRKSKREVGTGGGVGAGTRAARLRVTGDLGPRLRHSIMHSPGCRNLRAGRHCPTKVTKLAARLAAALGFAASAAQSSGCARASQVCPDPYRCADERQQQTFKLVGVPLPSGTEFSVHQGPFGAASHRERGNEYAWDLDVPYGTEVLAVDAGRVIDVYAPGDGAGCDPRYAAEAHNIKIEHADGTVAQYVHVNTWLGVGTEVHAGDRVGVTAHTGYICQPHLHLGVYRSRHRLYDSPDRESLPLRFVGIDGGLLIEGQAYRAP